MNTLKESLIVDCPIHDIMVYAERFLASHRPGQKPATFTLVVDLAELRLPGHIQARHDVQIAYRAAKEQNAISLAWDPRDNIVPKFAGVLHAQRSEGAHSILTLQGKYQPPLGIIGAAFDALIGKRIASATAWRLLLDIKASIESNYKHALATTLASAPKE